MMCAFMTPVLKNDWEIYSNKPNSKTNRRSRTTSENSQTTMPLGRTKSLDMRRRCLDQRSMSYAHSPSGRYPTDPEFMHTKTRPKAYHLSTRNSRNASRASFSPTHSHGHCGELMTVNEVDGKQTPSSIAKFHSKVLDKLRSVLSKKSSTSSEDKTGNKTEDEESETK